MFIINTIPDFLLISVLILLQLRMSQENSTFDLFGDGSSSQVDALIPVVASQQSSQSSSSSGNSGSSIRVVQIKDEAAFPKNIPKEIGLSIILDAGTYVSYVFLLF